MALAGIKLLVAVVVVLEVEKDAEVEVDTMGADIVTEVSGDPEDIAAEVGVDHEDIAAEVGVGPEDIVELMLGEDIVEELTVVESGARSKSSSAWVDTTLSSESLSRDVSESELSVYASLSEVERFLSLQWLLDIFLMLPLILVPTMTWVSRNCSRLVTTKPLRWNPPLALPSLMHWTAVETRPRIRILLPA